jgi:hypothetical protein
MKNTVFWRLVHFRLQQLQQVQLPSIACQLDNLKACQELDLANPKSPWQNPMEQ